MTVACQNVSYENYSTKSKLYQIKKERKKERERERERENMRVNQENFK